MKLNHKFKLTPIDENASKIQSVEADMATLLQSKTVPNYVKMALYESLMNQLQIFKQEEARPVAVEMYNTPKTDIIPTYPQLEHDRTFWEKLPGLRANDT